MTDNENKELSPRFLRALNDYREISITGFAEDNTFDKMQETNTVLSILNINKYKCPLY
jgi:hypothetical protein